MMASHEEGEDVPRLVDYNETSRIALDAFRKLANKYPVFERTYGQPKPIHLSKYLSYTQIVGIFNPFLMEANINVDVPSFTIPANMCHELAHMYGFMKEDEANYIAYLACMNSGDDDFMYSGILLALSYTLGELYVADVSRYIDVCYIFEKPVLGDLYVEKDYWAAVEDWDYQPVIAEVSNTVNDVFLRTNGQMNGIKSYREVVKFLVAEYRNR
jgi:hypothetical protein